MSSEKKVIIDIKSFAVKNNIKLGDICDEFGVSRVSLFNWRNQAPEMIKGILYASKQVPKMDVLTVLKGWQNPPHALAFISDFMIKYKCKFTDIVVEI